MQELLDFIKDNSPLVVVAIAVVYFIKVFVEKRMEGLAGRFDEIAKTSLGVKSKMREDERKELVDFRVALEKWEDFLQTLLFGFSPQTASDAYIKDCQDKDHKLFLKVKIAVVKVGIYLRNKELEQRLMAAVIKLRHTYYPIINESMSRLMELQSQLAPIRQKLAVYEQSRGMDMASAPTAADRDAHALLQAQVTQEMLRFSENLLKEYRGIAEQLVELKEAINAYIYRRIERTAIDKD